MYILICWSVAGRPGKEDLFVEVEDPISPAHTPRPEAGMKTRAAGLVSRTAG
jgi:hypothetical protein